MKKVLLLILAILLVINGFIFFKPFGGVKTHRVLVVTQGETGEAYSYFTDMLSENNDLIGTQSFQLVHPNSANYQKIMSKYNITAFNSFLILEGDNAIIHKSQLPPIDEVRTIISKTIN